MRSKVISWRDEEIIAYIEDKIKNDSVRECEFDLYNTYFINYKLNNNKSFYRLINEMDRDWSM